jgi:hypothetical protein
MLDTNFWGFLPIIGNQVDCTWTISRCLGIIAATPECSRRHAFIHPTLEQCYLFIGPGIVARHAAISSLAWIAAA